MSASDTVIKGITINAPAERLRAYAEAGGVEEDAGAAGPAKNCSSPRDRERGFRYVEDRPRRSYV